MNKVSHAIVKLRIPIFIIALVLVFPAAISYSRTKVNYDMLSYLPQDIDTMKGQNIMVGEFGSGAFSEIIVEGMTNKQVSALKEKVEKVDHVKTVLWYDSVLGPSVPMSMLPDDLYDAFNSGKATMLFVIYDDTSAADTTTMACREIRALCDVNCFVAGITPVLIDTQQLADKEAPVYVILAVIFATIILMISMDSFIVPFLFLASIGMAIIYNLGTNFLLGSISYVTKALAAVLQLGVTMDYSIFLWHSYEEELDSGLDREEAMAQAISATFSSVVGSSITTIAGFIALCFMSYTLGMDLGLCMSKGVLFGVICCVTVLPSMVLIFDPILQKTRHKALIPEFNGLGKWVLKRFPVFLIIFFMLVVPGAFGNSHVKVYYNLDRTLPDSFESIIANKKLEEDFDMGTTDMLMLNAKTPAKDVQKLADEIKNVDGVNFVVGVDTIKGAGIPDSMIPDELMDSLQDENWKVLLIGSQYKVASDEINKQCDTIKALAKSFDENSMLVGEAPATYDLITTTNRDIIMVNSVSIGIIFVIIALVFRSISLPFILVAVIEGGILVNMGLPYYMGQSIPFIASIVIGTIQLGSTVDYAILETTRYLRERRINQQSKYEAVRIAVRTSSKSIFVSALSFFAATFGVGLYSNIDLISVICVMMARGALISMGCVIFVLPGFLMIFDKLILKTTMADRSVTRAKAKEKVKARIAKKNAGAD